MLLYLLFLFLSPAFASALYIDTPPEMEVDMSRALAVVGVGILVAIVLILLLSHEAGLLDEPQRIQEKKNPDRQDDNDRGRVRRAVSSSPV
ncbi:hypothetical protein CcaverHIS002_0306340 [Cutaneotrichosporon cavernicola]|uniref:Dolichol phosphate-mannose biosynthesis regulatory protein n=1 Tax=Cutaneotrichosporon cavernicola TaxID=279322 RepID=A0AA48KZI6_9TREE|nr:uncharacterized protein CcaverHIS019_0306290 [Cutaneotrichosporon cavernicola]BEI82766.1 hypothetical protein CcaverHIS002_0306340 [Cutaneotrichosporon cavernicola]BEI90559.1 hypothetical protein CcaverHIS019_0306290 [Cutaneotrichosporon cavernicola]BEI98333.1 hypothetical protein CcaverHIS631_0306320 [Cutaneotrichosporon cavernicola]BEJ06109.1 hypothetical protein CcaverHIS641_0306310 [Cutaneotrichosporon cavernicola]